MSRFLLLLVLPLTAALLACNDPGSPNSLQDPQLSYQPYSPNGQEIVLSRAEYQERLQGFWLGQCIANWTGLVTEMDKIGGNGLDGRGAGFYTRENWGGPEEPNIWQNNPLDSLAQTIDFVVEGPEDIWGADDDTDIEYIYQALMYQHQTTQLSAEQIRDGWLTHIYSDENTPFNHGEGKPENYLWVSNQTAHDLMREGKLPPETSDPELNPNYEMIDAQLTTEIFGFFAPTRPDIAVEIAHLPIRVTAQQEAAWIAEFYVIMYSLAPAINLDADPAGQTQWLAAEARKHLPEDSYAADMYDFVWEKYQQGIPWELTRDSLHILYQEQQRAGYTWAEEPACNGCFAAGINFAAGMVSWFYGEGDFQETIKIGALAGWDSDNPTATWGGLLGFLLGKSGVETAMGQPMSDRFNIHRTRGGFPNEGIDNFDNMANVGVYIVDRIVQERLGGGIDLEKNLWYIPPAK